MQNDVLSWNVAIDKGFNPSMFPYTAEHVPVGNYDATLEFKIWAKKVMGICCYFTQTETGKKFQLTVYRQPGSKKYTLDKSDKIDFTKTPIGRRYHLNVFINEKGRIVFQEASLMV